jgi:hypothetical protein
MSDSGLDLSNLIISVRTELENADMQLRNADKPTLFRLSSIELELHFVVKSADEVKGGFDLKIVSLGSKLAEASEEVQKIKVKFEVPQDVRKSEVMGSRFFSEESPSQKRRSKSITPLE